MSSLIIADVTGFVAIIVPGGLGVREGVMYLLLTGVSTTALSLLLPIATRVVTMLVDISLGTTAVVLLNSYKNARGGDENAGNAN
jgi:glycosyltransferase 2 family protein